MLLWPGRWPVVWSRRCRCLRSSVALAGKVAGCLELKMAPPRSSATLARPRNGWHSVFHTVTRAACPPRSPGAKKAPAGACATNLSGLADPRALTRKVAGCLELKMAPPTHFFSFRFFSTSFWLFSSELPVTQVCARCLISPEEGSILLESMAVSNVLGINPCCLKKQPTQYS